MTLRLGNDADREWVKREYRLRQSSDISRVRRTGKSFPHPLIVLVILPNPEGKLRIGVAAGKVVGSAVHRNRAKRQLRACIDRLMPGMATGWDLLFLARAPIENAKFEQIFAGVQTVLQRAGILGRESVALNDRERLSQ